MALSTLTGWSRMTHLGSTLAMALGLLLGLSGVLGAQSPLGEDVLWRFTLEQHGSAPRIDLPPTSVIGDILLVRGTFQTGCATETIAGRADLEGERISLYVRARMPDGGGCLFMTEFYSYEFSLPLPSPGQYDVEVRHKGDAYIGPESTVVFSGVVRYQR